MISQYHNFCLKMGCGHSTNTRAELLALWELLYFVVAFGLPSLNVRGYSFVIVNWTNDVAALPALDLDYWCDIINELKASFFSFDF